ncbi:Minor histocompatibility protein HA-1 [Acipenser ruthenus]|uniref:Minor histocompatibility protein HA-1 n=1 Tax=Acipenser ruthenus TaxID=7906 RepID=A0A444UZH5_ACIRT|nr:Minor histocompatibility protein HA-1 [Acipenser ruthenus]
MDAESNLRKAKQAYMARCEEYDKAKHVTIKAEEEQQGTSSSNTTKSLDKKRRLEEEARNKAEEAEATYRTCIADAKTQKQELEDVKVNVLRQLQEVIKQSDQMLRSATISYYQIMHMQTAPLPVHYQTLCESSKLYDPGQQYASYVKQLRMTEEPEAHYDFEHYAATTASLAGRGSVLQLGEKLEGRRPLAHECLGEVLRILRQVISMYPLLNTVETLTAAGTLISKLSVLQEQPRKDASDSAPVLLEPPSCPGTPSPLSKLAPSTSSAGTLKRPTALSRHASAAGFPMQAAGTWGFSKGHRGALSYSPTAESGEGTIIEVEDIAQLLRHVARFAESVEKLKDVVLGEGSSRFNEPRVKH